MKFFAVFCTVALIIALAKTQAAACPFCSAAMQTLGQEIASSDGAVIAELVKPMSPAAIAGATGVTIADPTTESATFRIVKMLRGEEKIGGAKEIEVVYFGDDPKDKKFLITGLAAITPDKIEWTTPVPLSPEAVKYVETLQSLPEAGVERLTFFQNYLEHADPLLRQDSYDEFARAPYADVIALGPHMKREKLIEWINDPNVGPSGRRLYLTMLGVCGKPEDVPMLEKLLSYDYQLMKPGVAAALGLMRMPLGTGLLDEMVHADERRKKESLDALIACYLILKGPEGLELVNEKFLGNPTVEYKHLHSAIMALRFHGEETEVLPREKLLQSMRLALDHKEFADQVIPDLTRWEDWEVMPRLVTMFKESPKDDWIRQPVASYVLVAAEQPGAVGEKAKATLADLEKLDPETVERARSLSAFSFLARAAAAPEGEAAATAVAGETTDSGSVAKTQAAGSAADEIEGAKPQAAGDSGSSVAAATKTSATSKSSLSPPAASTLPVPSRLKIIGVPLVAAALMLAIFAVLLRGTDPRSSEESGNI
ncbi:MAG TPA: hypothetical protein VF175_18745 [Lacipirellula sp.]